MGLSYYNFCHEKRCSSKKFRAPNCKHTKMPRAYCVQSINHVCISSFNGNIEVVWGMLLWLWYYFVGAGWWSLLSCTWKLKPVYIFYWVVRLFLLQLSICSSHFKFMCVLLNYRDMRSLMLPVCENTRNLQKWKT